ncbi:hypothetical protein GCM10010274_24560 [Streptomyces lavendofoliae]|uniref:LPXTG cell wall anchor domain-containing protein n=2 Tax=Streptomyces lavendofoliae TaxID=67314 RepID=A0A918HXA9_9ACTN|nr:hypothetical protein GCM10010274_24560 [Streptomyces lavendofoliae]
MRFALRTAVATALLAGAALTPVATATAALAAEGARPAPAGAAQPAPAQPAPADAVAPAAGARPGAPEGKPGTPEGKPGTPADEPGTGAGSGTGAEPAAGGTQTDTATGTGEREPVKTVPLVEGMSAQVFRVDGRPEADVLKAGRTLFTLKAGEKRTYNRVEVLLKADGRVIPRQVDEDMGRLIRTGTLENGTYVKIYRVTGNHHRADAFIDGASIGVLDADGRSVAGQHDVQYFVLEADGSTYNWLGRENVVTAAKPGVYKLPNGLLIQIVRTVSGRYGISACDDDGCPKGAVFVDDTGRSVLREGSAVVVLDRDGTFSHYLTGAATQDAAVYVGAEVPGADRGGDKAGNKGGGEPGGGTAAPAATTAPAVSAQGSTSQTTVVPRGGVAAGAETSGEDGDPTPLVASGAGAAALSAAALGFVAMRRRRAADHG